MTTAEDGFAIPPELIEQVREIGSRYSLTPGVIAGGLRGIGLPIEQANTITVEILMRWACALALTNAVEVMQASPSRERWLQATGNVFDEVQRIYLTGRGTIQ